MVEVENRIRQHVEFAEILPAVSRVGREQDYAAPSGWDIYNRRTVADLLSALHQAAHHRVVAAGELGQHPPPPRLWNAQQRTARPPHGHSLIRVPVENG